MAGLPEWLDGLQIGCNPLSSQVTNSTRFAKIPRDFNGQV
jgi:hypothetical protein